MSSGASTVSLLDCCGLTLGLADWEKVVHNNYWLLNQDEVQLIKPPYLTQYLTPSLTG